MRTSYFTPYTPMDPPKFKKNAGSSHSAFTNDNEASYKVSSLYDQASQRRSEHKLFHTIHSSWIHQNSEKLLDPPILAIQTSTNDNKALNKVSSLSNWPSSSKHQLLHTLHPSWIHHNL